MRQVVTFDAYGTLIERAYAVLNIPSSRVTHVAQEWEYDLIPTRDLGLRRQVWINRYGRPGSTLYRPCDQLPSLAGVPTLLGPAHTP